MLKSLSVSSSLLCFASVSLASTAIVTVPYLLADSRSDNSRSSQNSKSAQAKSTQCRALFENVVDARRVGSGFYQRKAANIRSLRLSDSKLQSLQSQFGQVFTNLESAQRSADTANTAKLGRQASQLVSELNRHCFQ